MPASSRRRECTNKHNIRDTDTLAQMTTPTAGLIGRRLLYRDLILDNGIPSGAGVGSRYAPFEKIWSMASSARMNPTRVAMFHLRVEFCLSEMCVFRSDMSF